MDDRQSNRILSILRRGRARGNGAGASRAAAGRRPEAEQPCGTEQRFQIAWSLDRSCDVGRALVAAKRLLSSSGFDTAQLDSAVLLAYVLGVNKAWLYSHPTRRLTEIEIARYEDLLRRRLCAEPIAYLVGFKSFYGLDITVDRRVLIPRPETELLVERVLGHVRGLAAERERDQPPGPWLKIADLGTGSGAIAVALAVNAPEVLVYATDASEAALEVAAQNVWRYGLGDQVQLLPGHLLEPLPEPVDLIVANLPYVRTGDLASLPPQVRDFEPIQALDGGPDGLRVIAELLESLASPAVRVKLKPGGRIYLEIGADQAEAAKRLAQRCCPAASAEVLVDYAGLDRVLVLAF